MTQFTFTAADRKPDAGAALADLARWMENRDELSARVDVHTRPPAAGELGGVADAVAVLAASTPLAKAFFSWLTERAKNGRVSVVVARPDGARLQVDAEDSAAATRLLPEVRSFFAEGGGEGDGD